jgi:hypothetical protein
VKHRRAKRGTMALRAIGWSASVVIKAASYVVEWLRRGVVIDREKLPLSARTVSQAIQAAHIQSIEMKTRLTGDEPDSFRLRGENEREIGFSL